jgi:hypothetical protein
MTSHAGGDPNESGRMAKSSTERAPQRAPTLANPTASTALSRRGGTITCSGGGRSWWAHLEFTRINIELTILHKKFEDMREAHATLLNAAALIVTHEAPAMWKRVFVASRAPRRGRRSTEATAPPESSLKG